MRPRRSATPREFPLGGGRHGRGRRRRTRPQVLHRPGDQDLGSTGARHDPVGEGDGDASDVVASHLDLTGVDPRAHLQAQRRKRLPYGVAAADGTSGSVEGCQDPIAGALHQSPAVAFDRAPHVLVVAIQDLSPASVTEGDVLPGRADEVGEQNSGEHPVCSRDRLGAGQERPDFADD